MATEAQKPTPMPMPLRVLNPDVMAAYQAEFGRLAWNVHDLTAQLAELRALHGEGKCQAVSHDAGAAHG